MVILNESYNMPRGAVGQVTPVLGGGADLEASESSDRIGSSLIAFNVDILCCITDLLPSFLSSLDFLFVMGEAVLLPVGLFTDRSDIRLDLGLLEIEPTTDPADDAI